MRTPTKVVEKENAKKYANCRTLSQNVLCQQFLRIRYQTLDTNLLQFVSCNTLQMFYMNVKLLFLKLFLIGHGYLHSLQKPFRMNERRICLGYHIKCQCFLRIETSQLNCCANQLSSFHMRATMAFNGLIPASNNTCFSHLENMSLDNKLFFQCSPEYEKLHKQIGLQDILETLIPHYKKIIEQSIVMIQRSVIAMLSNIII